MKIIYSLLIVVHDGIGPSAPLEEDGGLPDWAIAVVVIGLGSFAFVLVFGITVVSTIQLMMYEFFIRYYDVLFILILNIKNNR